MQNYKCLYTYTNSQNMHLYFRQGNYKSYELQLIVWIIILMSQTFSCSNYIFILHLTPGFNILRKDNCKPSRETFEFWDLVLLY